MNSKRKYKIAYVASEVVPFAKTGGLADVAGSLPKFLSQLGADVKVFMPKYSLIDTDKHKLFPVNFISEMKVRVSGIAHNAAVYKSALRNSDVEIYFIENTHYFNRTEIYTNDVDEADRFIFFQKAVIETIQRLDWVPDIIHCNDWQTGLIPLLLKDNYSWDRLFNNTKIIITIHNVGYQGVFVKETGINAELKPEYYLSGGVVELNGNVNFLKAGIVFSDLITTVSPTYSKELLTEEFGHGLEIELQKRSKDICGIINGVDYSIWNPELDKDIPYRFSKNNLNGKKLNKKFLLTELGLRFNSKTPVIGIVSRLVSQKGFDIIEEILPEIMKLKIQLIILGSGEKRYEKLFTDLKKMYARKTAFYSGYNSELAHLIEAGSDIFLMPSHYEPCGLNQIYSLKYGTVPIVRKTGGLADTVIDWEKSVSKGKMNGNGFVFNNYDSKELLIKIKHAVRIFKNKPVWKQIIRNGMNCDYSWQKSAGKYIELYGKVFNK